MKYVTRTFKTTTIKACTVDVVDNGNSTLLGKTEEFVFTNMKPDDKRVQKTLKDFFGTSQYLVLSVSLDEKTYAMDIEKFVSESKVIESKKGI